MAVSAAIRALRTSGHFEHHDHLRWVVDHVDNPEDAGAQPPEIGPGELHGTRRPRLDRQREDRATQARGLTRREATQLTLGGRRELDSVAAFAHSSPVP